MRERQEPPRTPKPVACTPWHANTQTRTRSSGTEIVAGGPKRNAGAKSEGLRPRGSARPATALAASRRRSRPAWRLGQSRRAQSLGWGRAPGRTTPPPPTAAGCEGKPRLSAAASLRDVGLQPAPAPAIPSHARALPSFSPRAPSVRGPPVVKDDLESLFQPNGLPLFLSPVLSLPPSPFPCSVTVFSPKNPAEELAAPS